jgi:hypothetical protein
MDYDQLLQELKLIEDEENEEIRKEKLLKIQDKLPEDITSQYYKRMNPYGTVINGDSKSRAIVSIVNMRMAFAEALALNANVGYLYRSLREFDVANDIVPVDIEDYVRDPSIIDKKYPKEMLDKNATLATHVAEYKKSMEKRLIIKEFLDRHYEFNPDLHAKTEYKASKDPKETAQRVADVRKKCGQTEWLKHIDTLPKDTRFRVNTYMRDHYEQLRETVMAAFNMPDDIDLSMIVHGEFDSEQKANEFKQRHADNFNMETVDIPVGKVVLLGPYRQNREKTQFLSKNAELLRSMVDARTEDSKFASDVFKKRVTRIKKQAKKEQKDVKEDKEAEKLVKNVFGAQVKSMGAISVDDEEELEKDLIEIPIHKLGGGGLEYKKELIYNKADTAVNIGGNQQQPTTQQITTQQSSTSAAIPK